MFAQQPGELSEIGLGPVVHGAFHFGMFREVVAEDVADLVDGCGDQAADDVGGVFGLFAVGLLFDQGDEVAQGAALVGAQLQTRVGCDSEEERHHVFRVDIEVAQELGGDNQHVALEVALCARFMSLDDVFRPEDEERILAQAIFVQVERYAGFAFRADADDEGVDAARREAAREDRISESMAVR